MRPTLSLSRLILFTLAVVTLVSLSEGDGAVKPTCYHKYSNKEEVTNVQNAPKWAKHIISCSEQNHHDCLPGYVVETSRRTFFLRPNTEWLTAKINEGALNCSSVISK